jgi:hypothetical protein
MEITIIQTIGVIVVIGGALLGFLWFMTKLWFVLMGARALVKYVEGPQQTSRRYGTPVSEWKGSSHPREGSSRPQYGKPLRLIKGGRDEV